MIAPALAEPVDDERVLRRPIVLEHERAECGGHPDGVDLVLDEDRDTVQRAGEAGLLEAGVEPIGVLQGPRVDGDDGVEHRTALVVRVNSIQVLLRERACGERAAGERLMDVGHGRFNHFEGRRGPPAALRVPDRRAGDSRHERCLERPAAHWRYCSVKMNLAGNSSTWNSSA